MVTEPKDENTDPQTAQTADNSQAAGHTGGRAGRFAKWTQRFVLILTPAMLISVLMTFLGAQGSVNWLLDLLSHFKMQYLIFQSIYLVFACTTRRWLLIAVCAAGAIANAVDIAPFYTTPLPVVQSVGADSARVSILQFNLNSHNRQFDGVLNLIRQYNPDIICMQEVDGAWDRFLKENLLKLGYTDSVSKPREDNFGIGIYSKLPLASGQIIEGGHFIVPGAFATFPFAGKTLSVMTVHPLPPMSEQAFALRNDEFVSINAAREKIKDPFILAGDLNCSPWSYYFNKLLSRSKLSNTALGRGLQPTWPAHVLGIRIPIDHVLVSRDLVAVDYQVLPSTGSDHHPVFVQLALQAVGKAPPKERVPTRK